MYFLKDSTKSDEYYLVNFFPHYCVVGIFKGAEIQTSRGQYENKEIEFLLHQSNFRLGRTKKVILHSMRFSPEFLFWSTREFSWKKSPRIIYSGGTYERHHSIFTCQWTTKKIQSSHIGVGVTKLLFYIYYFSRQKYEIFIFRF